MTYLRVIPRDLFNEANLLKCIGQLYLLTDADPDCDFLNEECGFERFLIEQDDASGAIYVSNLTFLVHGQPCDLIRPLNSREPWPLYLSPKHDPDVVVSVFDDQGQLSKEMLDYISSPGSTTG